MKKYLNNKLGGRQMTMDELKDNWKQYAIKLWDTNEKILLQDVFMLCLGYHEGGLLFDTGGEQGNPAYIIKPDAESFCYCKNPKTGEWHLFGKFVKITDL